MGLVPIALEPCGCSCSVFGDQDQAEEQGRGRVVLPAMAGLRCCVRWVLTGR